MRERGLPKAGLDRRTEYDLIGSPRCRAAVIAILSAFFAGTCPTKASSVAGRNVISSESSGTGSGDMILSLTFFQPP